MNLSRQEINRISSYRVYDSCAKYEEPCVKYLSKE